MIQQEQKRPYQRYIVAEMREGNARDPEQALRMRRLKELGLCFFCEGNYHRIVEASPAIYETPYWYIKKNDYPYPGSVHHYLIVSKRHICFEHELTDQEWTKLRTVKKWLQEEMHVKGWSTFVREGDLSYTGATFDHLHFHFVVGGPKPPDWTPENAGEKCLPITLGYRVE